MNEDVDEPEIRIPAGTEIRFIMGPIKLPLPVPATRDLSALTTSFSMTFQLTEDQCDDLRLMCSGFDRVEGERLKALKRLYKAAT